jgi:hypothetical protein
VISYLRTDPALFFRPFLNHFSTKSQACGLILLPLHDGMSSRANGSHNDSKTLAIRGKNQRFSFATAPEELRYGDSLQPRGTLGFDVYVQYMCYNKLRLLFDSLLRALTSSVAYFPE